MIQATFTIQLGSIEKSFDSSGTQICKGTGEIQNYSSREPLMFRCRGTAAVNMTEGCAGVVVGYIDLVDVQTETHKQKITTMVIREFVTTKPGSEPELVGSGYGPKVELEF